MPVNYYIIPQTAGPYSRSNPQMPMYVDEIRCNWTGHPVPGFDFFNNMPLKSLCRVYPCANRIAAYRRITSYNVCYTKLLRP